MPRKDDYYRVVWEEVKLKDVEDHGGLLRRERTRQLRRYRCVIPFDQAKRGKRHEKASGRLVGRARDVWLTQAC